MNHLDYADFTIEKKCIVCGETVRLSLLSVCDTCQKREKDNRHRAQQFLKENPSATKSEIAEKTGISEKTVNWYYKSKKLSEDTQNSRFNMTGSQNKGVTITDTIYGNFVWVDVSGKLDSTNAFELQHYINQLIEDGWTDIILNMHSVTFFSSTGIRVVLAAYKQLYENGSFRITNPNKNVENVIGMVALDRMLLK